MSFTKLGQCHMNSILHIIKLGMSSVVRGHARAGPCLLVKLPAILAGGNPEGSHKMEIFGVYDPKGSLHWPSWTLEIQPTQNLCHQISFIVLFPPSLSPLRPLSHLMLFMQCEAFLKQGWGSCWAIPGLSPRPHGLMKRFRTIPWLTRDEFSAGCSPLQR